ncbi:(2Fe-2S)-binding protein [Nocardioides marinquilinus]|uniref:(2Fe-2S)-binding protein n=1 Tax=Nocardioides marinquilinus TaxID=1210400 RepID=A0ABP9PCG8_9ACTN
MTAPIRVNGRPEHVDDVAPLTPLADVLRDRLGLTGTKLGCRAGDCGSCTVLVDDVPKTSCLVPAGQAAGHDVTTIEGLVGQPEHAALLAALRRHNASQCGFCTPGIVVALAALLRDAGPDGPTRDDVRAGLAGNLCRCTGYESIVDAVLEAAGEAA